MKNWKSPKIIIGAKAIGKDYYNRTDIEDLIIDEVKKGNHINIAAPRRVGKTSVVYYISKNKLKNYHCIFESIQSLQSEKAVYKKIYELILGSFSSNKQIIKKLKNYFSGRGIKNISLDGVEFNQKKEISYINEIENICSELIKNDIKVVLFIDELPDVLYYIYKYKTSDEAIRLLRNLRVWRQNEQFKNLSLVLTGSIGFNHIVKMIEGRSVDLNDLHNIKFEAFTKKQAIAYIHHVTKDATITYSANLAGYILDKVSYLIPYFINLILREVDLYLYKNNLKTPTKKIINTAFDIIVKENKYFDDWKDRLIEYYPDNEARFMNEILVYLAHYDSISLRRLYDLAIKHKRDLDYMSFIEILENDGYIVENKQVYTFLSPFLKAFWKKDQPIYTETK